MLELHCESAEAAIIKQAVALLEFTSLPGFRWIPGKQARLWFLQPRLHVSKDPPFVALSNAPDATGLDLLRATLTEEEKFEPPDDAPTFVLLPEFAVSTTEIGDVLALIKSARANTVFIFGTGQLSEKQARQIDDADLWEPNFGKFTNCAAVGIGGYQKLYLQPKIVPSKWEQASHWPGKKIRYFEGQFTNFVVVICSELLAAPAGQTTLAGIVTELQFSNKVLSLVIWLQHNENPRSHEFDQSIGALKEFEPGVLVVSSRNERPKRLKNFAVSGALVPQWALPAHFDVLDAPFRYVEPLSQAVDVPMSRLVLLRYDADVYRVNTVAPASLRTGHGTAKGALFRECDPFTFQSGQLQTSFYNYHLRDILTPACTKAKQMQPGLGSEIDTIVDKLVESGTQSFMAILDVGTLPAPQNSKRHAAGQQHDGGDYLCRCWVHRTCVDFISEAASSTESVATLIETAAALLDSSVEIQPRYDRDTRTNFLITLDQREIPLGIVDAADMNAEGARKALWAGDISMNGSAYIVRRTAGPTRPPIATTNPAQAKPRGKLQASSAETPTLNAIYEHDFREAAGNGKLATLIRERFAE